MAKTTVRLTMFDHPIEVDEDELLNLRNQGLLVEDEPEPDPQPEPAATKTARKPAKAASETTEEP